MKQINKQQRLKRVKAMAEHKAETNSRNAYYALAVHFQKLTQLLIASVEKHGTEPDDIDHFNMLFKMLKILSSEFAHTPEVALDLLGKIHNFEEFSKNEPPIH